MICIKDMDMPQNCAECPCMRHDSRDGINGYQCNLTLDTWDDNTSERWPGRGCNCPLKSETGSLKRCPFCGSENVSVIEHKFHRLPNSYGVRCINCKAESYQFYESAQQAIKEWNRRAKDE